MTTSDASNKGSKLKDLVVTAAVASVVSALVYPWMRRWLDPITSGLGPPQALPPGNPSREPPADDFDARLERLLDVPDPFAPGLRYPRGQDHSRRNETHDDDDDLEP